jgi:hypothetical protein
VTDPKSGLSLPSNEVIVKFSDNTSSSRKNDIAASIGGSITGYYPILEVYQIKLGTSTLNGVDKAIKALLEFPEVTDARPNYYGNQPFEVIPNDTYYVGTQYGPQKIRADEAWIITGGGRVIAVIDTGVDYTIRTYKLK